MKYKVIALFLVLFLVGVFCLLIILNGNHFDPIFSLEWNKYIILLPFFIFLLILTSKFLTTHSGNVSYLSVMGEDILSPIIEEMIFTILPIYFILNNSFFVFIFIIIKPIFFSTIHFLVYQEISLINIYVLIILGFLTTISLILTNNFIIPILIHISFNLNISFINKEKKYV